MAHQKGKLSAFIYRNFILILGFSLLFIFTCYKFVLSTVQQGASEGEIIFESLVFVGIFYALLVTAARFRAKPRQRDQATSWTPASAISFLFLFLFSGYGIFCAFMLLYEGPNILRQHLQMAIDSYARLQAVAWADLPDRDYEELVKRVRSNQSGLIRELRSAVGGNYCGVGKNAMAQIEALRRDLNGFVPLNGSERNHNCNDPVWDEIVADYNRDIDTRLKEHPMIAEHNLVARSQLLQTITQKERIHREQLTHDLATLSGVSNLLFNFQIFPNTVRSLQRAASDYVTLRESLVSLTTIPRTAKAGAAPEDDVTIPAAAAAASDAAPKREDIERKLGPGIDLTTLDRLVSAFGVVSVMLQRLDRPVTWMAFLLTFAGDWLFLHLVRDALVHHRSIQISLPERLPFAETGVTYLWRPAPPKDQSARLQIEE